MLLPIECLLRGYMEGGVDDQDGASFPTREVQYHTSCLLKTRDANCTSRRPPASTQRTVGRRGWGRSNRLSATKTRLRFQVFGLEVCLSLSLICLFLLYILLGEELRSISRPLLFSLRPPIPCFCPLLGSALPISASDLILPAFLCHHFQPSSLLLHHLPLSFSFCCQSSSLAYPGVCFPLWHLPLDIPPKASPCWSASFDVGR
ncbi:hypothetical protein O6H91_08G022700 [Diphasiastrum complanatum]|uniref:Uncharacterized protein n=1 Tax=Diphasiastrum complanatum TaxID=34168 RepID=A0ACC2CVQ8_DIPCM|nr:hypothetical protein O6H91_08G022700 [Diphasiastrum complanatum]